jgi:hypothetical protein
VGVIAAHQNLDQLDKRLQAAVMASTAIKLAGGCSAKDASAFARKMRCEPELIQGMRKHARHTEFACWVKNATPRPLRLAVPFGQLEGRERMSDAEYAELLALNRSRYSADAEEAGASGMMGSRSSAPKATGGFELGEHEVL